MKKNYVVLLMLFLTLSVNSQVLNPSFENWTTKQNMFTVTAAGFFICGDFTYNEPTDWSSTNQLTGAVDVGATELVTQSATAVNGSSSIEMRSMALGITPHSTNCAGPIVITFTNVAPGLIVSGEFSIDEQSLVNDLVGGNSLESLNPFTYPNTGQAIDFMPKSIKGSYHYTGMNGDSALIFSGAIKDGEIIAHVIQRLGNTGIWTDFQLDFDYATCEQPDTIITVITSSNLDVSFDPVTSLYSLNSNYTGEDGSNLLIDNLTMDTVDLASFPPIANNDTSAIFNNETATSDVVANDEFCDGSMPNPVIITTVPSGGSVSFNVGTGNLEFTPNSNFSGIVDIEYYVCNGGGLCDTAVWSIEVSAIPICDAVDDNRSLNENASSVFDPLANDMDCGGAPTIITLPLNGVANVESNNFISYSPVTDFVGMDSLTYQICNTVNTSQCDTAIIRYEVLEVTGINALATSSITIAPNPASNEVKITLDASNTILTQIVVFNLLGKTVYSSSFSGQISLNLRDYSTGVYLVQLENKNGKATRKLVVSK